MPDVVDKVLEFQYDAAGLRTQKKYIYTNGEGQEVVETTDYFLHGKLLMHLKKTVEVNGVQTEEPRQLHFFYDKDAQPIMVRMGGDEEECRYFTFVKNLQGDVLGILGKTLDNAGVLRVEYLYDPWGRFLRSLTTAYDESAAVLAELNPFRYRGYLYDEETGLYYLRTRYYNPEWGRFMNADSLIGAEGELLSHNLFSYCKNDPILCFDPDGEAVLFSTSIALPMPISFPAIPYIPFPNIGLPFLLPRSQVSRKIPAQRRRYKSRKEAYDAAKRAGGGREPKLMRPDEGHPLPRYHPDVPQNFRRTPHQATKHDHYYFPLKQFGLPAFIEKRLKGYKDGEPAGDDEPEFSILGAMFSRDAYGHNSILRKGATP